MNNCMTHKNRESVAECDFCGAPICDQCHDTFYNSGKGESLCAECCKNKFLQETAEVKAVRKIVKREFIFIIIGLIVGLGLSLYFYFNNSFTTGFLSDYRLYIIIALPFVLGSLNTILKKAAEAFSAGKDKSGDNDSIFFNLIVIIIIIIAVVFVAPIVTIYRIIIRIVDSKRLNFIEQTNYNLINSINNFIEQTTMASLVEQAARGTSDVGAVEVSLDSILSAGVEIGANGAILRKIRNR